MSVNDLKEIRLSGYVISSGIAIGKPFFLKTFQRNFQGVNVPPSKLEDEIKRFYSAVSKVGQDLQNMRKQLELEGVSEGVEILEAQIQLLHDPLIITEVEKQVRNLHKAPEFILQQLIEKYQKKFEAFENAFFTERFEDIHDISRRILRYLNQETKSSLHDLSSESILFAKDLSPAETAEASQKKVRAIISEKGSDTAHASILARAKEIPYMTNISLSMILNHPESLMIVDGKKGELIINPKQETLAHYEKLSSDLAVFRHRLRQGDAHDIETYDGYKMKLLANIETRDEIAKIHEFGGKGVGLYRSENILVGRHEIPSEDEQFEIYRELVESMQGLPITIRTFDVGRDKAGIDISYGQEGLAFLGFRGVGKFQRESDIFMAQMRAILRASVFGSVKILFPMVSSLSEFIQAKQMTLEAAQQVKIAPQVKLGCMIEVPSAAIISDLLAKEADFLAIGTNDLTQYTLAVDRCDHTLSHLYQPTHPCVLRLIKHVVQEANRHHVPVSICGEMAANPKFIPLLLGLGVHEISVTSRYIPLIKHTIRLSNILFCYELTEKALALTSASEILSLLDDAFEKHFARPFLQELM